VAGDDGLSRPIAPQALSAETAEDFRGSLKSPLAAVVLVLGLRAVFQDEEKDEDEDDRHEWAFQTSSKPNRDRQPPPERRRLAQKLL